MRSRGSRGVRSHADASYSEDSCREDPDGMVGGGTGAFIGGAPDGRGLTGQIELVCGAFSSQRQDLRASGKALFLPADRVYGS